MENNASNTPQPPPGYPVVGTDQRGQQGAAAGERRKKNGSTAKRGEGSFIEGCIAALCCCWLCELCCD